MVRTTLVESEINKGREIITRLDDSSLAFSVIFWMYDEDADNWKLVFSNEDIQKLGKRYFYGELTKILSGSHLDEGISLTLIDSNDPLIKSLRKTMHLPNGNGIWFMGNSINGRMFPDAYLYRVI